VNLQHGATLDDELRASLRSNEKDHHERKDEPMKLTTMTQVTVDGVMQGNGGASDGDRRNGFERGGWAMGVGDNETMTFINQTYQRADAFLFGRRTYELFAGYWGAEERARAAGLGLPQTAQEMANGLPHLPQNFLPSGFSVPQLEQSILGGHYCAHIRCTTACWPPDGVARRSAPRAAASSG